MPSLHAGAARRDKQHERRPALDGGQHGGDDRLAGGHAERAAHKGEILDGDHRLDAIEGAEGGHHAIIALGLGARLLETVGIAPLVAKTERILSDLRERDLLEFAAIEHDIEPDVRRHAHMMAGIGDDELIGLEIAVENHLAGLGALDPHIVRQLALDAEEGSGFSGGRNS